MLKKNLAQGLKRFSIFQLTRFHQKNLHVQEMHSCIVHLTPNLQVAFTIAPALIENCVAEVNEW